MCGTPRLRCRISDKGVAVFDDIGRETSDMRSIHIWVKFAKEVILYAVRQKVRDQESGKKESHEKEIRWPV